MARVRRLLQAQGRGSGEQGDDRARDRAVTGSSLRLAFELRDEAALAAEAPVTPQLSEEELVNRFVEEFDAEVLPPEEEST